ncbi:hypothetical protein [Maricaulis sp.]|uniref:hypothetical protein n=1 Tax=Maricaulis sp. TaxID=1486257 RepID=UPI003298754F
MRYEPFEPDTPPIKPTAQDREVFAEDYPPETFDVGDTVTARLTHGSFEDMEIVKIFPKARRFRVRGWLGEYTRNGEGRIRSVEVSFDDVELEARAS